MAEATGIDHIAIYVTKLEEAKDFFIKGFGLRGGGDYGDEFFMEIGTQKIALFRGSNDKQTINHLALKVDDFEGVKKRLSGLGYEIYKEDMVDGPDGLRIQLVK
jgi:catechol 2,3-dioxygenase-like lactoylglutathione lyase family enzyme